MRFCPKCGESFKVGEQVCSQCGLVFPFSTDTLSPGTVLQKNYEIQQLIHSGGMGYIYLSLDRKLKRQCVVKQIKDRIKSASHLKKLEEEAFDMAKLSHPNIAMVLDHFVEDSYYYVVVEYIRGKTLSQVFEESNGRLEEEEVVKWAVSICDVIGYIHKRGIVHRDISPDNIMLTDEGFIKLVDFGTMRELSSIATTKASKEGKFGFTPPEQWQGQPVPQSDIFAMGATTYYLLTGFLPLSEQYRKGGKPQTSDQNPDYPPIRTKNKEVSSGLETVLERALQLDASDRFQTATELGKAFKNLKTKTEESPKEVIAAAATVQTVSKATQAQPVSSEWAAATQRVYQPEKAGISRGKIAGGITLLIIGLFALTFVILMLALTPITPDFSLGVAVAIAITIVILFVIPFVIPGILMIRRGLAPKQLTISAIGKISNTWWLLPGALGFIGGIACWFMGKDKNYRKALNMLVLGLIMTVVWPTVGAFAKVTQYRPPAAMHVDTQPVGFVNVNAGLSDGGSKNCTIENTGGQALTGELTTTKGWLHVDPTEINIAGGDKQTIRIWVDTKLLKPDFSDTGLINAKTNGGDAVIPVTLKTSTSLGRLIFSDDFRNTGSGWTANKWAGGEIAYEGSELSILSVPTLTVLSASNSTLGQMSDGSVEVDVRKISSGIGEDAGIIFRSQGENLYYFSISDSGTYYVAKWINNIESFIRDSTLSNYIKTGAATNRIGITFQGTKIDLYVNGNKIDTIYDSSLTRGDAELAVGSGQSANAHYHFDNFDVYLIQ